MAEGHTHLCLQYQPSLVDRHRHSITQQLDPDNAELGGLNDNRYHFELTKQVSPI